MGCDCKKTYSIGMGCCQPVLAPADNFYTKYQTDMRIEEAISGITVSGITEEQAEEMIEEATSGKANSSDVYTKLEVNDLLADKQDKLTAGTGLDITNNVISVTGGSQPVDAYTKAESDAKFTTITNFNSHSGNTTVHITAQERTTWNAKPNVWCGNESEWSQISGSTESGTIYLVY